MIVFVWTEIKICVYYRLRLQSSSCGRSLNDFHTNKGNNVNNALLCLSLLFDRDHYFEDVTWMRIKSLFFVLFLMQSTLSYIKKTSSLEAYIEWFNRLSYLVATEICLVRILCSQRKSVNFNLYCLLWRFECIFEMSLFSNFPSLPGEKPRATRNEKKKERTLWTKLFPRRYKTLEYF